MTTPTSIPAEIAELRALNERRTQSELAMFALIEKLAAENEKLDKLARDQNKSLDDYDQENGRLEAKITDLQRRLAEKSDGVDALTDILIKGMKP